MSDAHRPPNSHTRLVLRVGTFCVFAPMLLASMVAGLGGGVAAAKSPVKPRPGAYSGDVGAFTLSFKVSPDSEKLTGLRTDLRLSRSV